MAEEWQFISSLVKGIRERTSLAFAQRCEFIGKYHHSSKVSKFSPQFDGGIRTFDVLSTS
jgi:hypothetical protein